jgi:glycosyl transferase/beta-hydroxylase protein BlmF
MSSIKDIRVITTEPERISILCPTRNRPDQLVAMMDSALKMASKPQLIEFCLYIDLDDDSCGQIEFSENVKIVRGPRMWLSSMYNALITAASGDYFFWSGDDVIFLTYGWDEELRKGIKSFPSKLGVVHVNDMATSYPQKYATIGMVHRIWVDVFGYIFTPHLRDNGIDFWISNVANQTGRRLYLGDVKVEHRQYRQGKVTIDQTYIDRLDDHKTYSPLEIYRLLIDERRRDALLLQAKDCDIRIKFNLRYLFANVFLSLNTVITRKKISQRRKIYIGSQSNLKFLITLLKKIGIKTRINHWDN